MRTNLKQFAGLSLRPFYPIIGLIVINLILIGGVIFGGFNLTEKYTIYSQLKTETDTLQGQVDLVNENRKIDQDKLDAYNELLTKLIPEEEDYFFVISAIEQLSTQTGFSLSRYSINLSSSTAEKLSLNIDGGGDANSFLRFLNTYQYGGGRLITNENMEFSPQNFRSVRLSLNFYHRKTPATPPTGNKKITEQDFKLIEDILGKMRQTAQ